MPEFKAGEKVAVQAIIQSGAFPGEHLVTVETRSGSISGFVRDQDIVEPNRTIQAVVSEATPGGVAVRLAGSYFTTNGLAEFSADWARKHVKAIA